MKGRQPKDITGQRFGNLIAYEPTHTSQGTNRIWHCLCDCGHTTNVPADALIRARTISCTRCNEHTATGKRLRQIWWSMLLRCYYPKATGYKHWGGRGIRVCLPWHVPRIFFQWMMEHGYNDSLTIDRYDENADYTPDNCFLSPRAENSRNRWIKKTKPQTS